MIRDKEYSAAVIQQMLLENVIDRNKELNTFMGLLNSVKYNTFIAIDGRWGSGKSVFVKQLEYLSTCDLNDDRVKEVLSIQTGIKTSTVSDFQSKYLTFYYNAWENDDHHDPLQSLLFSLIDALYAEAKVIEKIEATSKKVVQSMLIAGVKTLTKGIVDINEINDVETIDDLVKEITTINERKRAVSKIINSILPDDMHLLFIIDELDRCSPDFAVRLLEAAKHYCNDDKITFVISTNNSQLMHTVKKHYGNEFDGYGYLNKFYDLVFQLPEVTVNDYITKQLKVPDDSYWKNIMPREVVEYLGFTLRETNRYYSSISLVWGYIGTESHFDNSLESNMAKYVFTPFALGLKIHNNQAYEEFIKGKGEEIFSGFINSSNILRHFISRTVGRDKSELKPLDVGLGAYRRVLAGERLSDQKEDYFSEEVRERFKNAINLISSTGKLDEDAS
jgi:hypothetical protein